MDKAGPGARGIVFGIPDTQSSKDGHFFNVANQRDVVRLLDGQTGTAADPSRFERFRVMRTNP
jgi:filamentous hemagglutinin